MIVFLALGAAAPDMPMRILVATYQPWSDSNDQRRPVYSLLQFDIIAPALPSLVFVTIGLCLAVGLCISAGPDDPRALSADDRS